MFRFFKKKPSINVYAIIQPRSQEILRRIVSIDEGAKGINSHNFKSLTEAEATNLHIHRLLHEATELEGEMRGLKLAADLINEALNP